jgi:hypothetical protein
MFPDEKRAARLVKLLHEVKIMSIRIRLAIAE